MRRDTTWGLPPPHLCGFRGGLIHKTMRQLTGVMVGGGETSLPYVRTHMPTTDQAGSCNPHKCFFVFFFVFFFLVTLSRLVEN